MADPGTEAFPQVLGGMAEGQTRPVMDRGAGVPKARAEAADARAE